MNWFFPPASVPKRAGLGEDSLLDIFLFQPSRVFLLLEFKDKAFPSQADALLLPAEASMAGTSLGEAEPPTAGQERGQFRKQTAPQPFDFFIEL